MSRFQVAPETVQGVSGRLGRIAPHVSVLHGRAAAHTGAGAATPAGPAVEALMGRWSQVLPLYALSAHTLSAAVLGAAGAYRESDTAIGGACQPPARGRHDA